MSKNSYDALGLCSSRWINTNVKAAIWLAPCPVQIPRFPSLIVGMSHEEVPACMLELSIAGRLRLGMRYLPSCCWIITRSIEVDPLRDIQVFGLIITCR
jgi:hypothetical protein